MERPSPDATGAPSAAEPINTALGLGGAVLRLTIQALREDGEPGMGRTFSLRDGKIALGMLVSDSSEGALRMFQAGIGKADNAEGIAGCYDAFATHPGTGKRYDALMVHVAHQGEEICTLAVPYVLKDGVVDFPEQVQALRVPDGREASSLAAVVLGSSIEGLTEVRTDFVDAVVAGATSASRSEGSDEDRLLRKLAALGPFAIFLFVGIDNGELHHGRAEAFARKIFADEGVPEVLSDVMAEVTLDPAERFEMLAGDKNLPGRAVAALGAVFDEHPEGADARSFVLEMAAELMQIDGEIDALKLLVLPAQLSQGRASALAGGDPFEGTGAGASSIEEIFDLAVKGPIAGFLTVAIADGDVDDDEFTTFFTALAKVKHPALQGLIAAGGDPRGAFRSLLQDSDQIPHCLAALAAYLEATDDSGTARREFMGVLRAVAMADGILHPNEERALEVIGAMLEGREPDAAIMGRNKGLPWLKLLGGAAVLGGLAWMFS